MYRYLFFLATFLLLTACNQQKIAQLEQELSIKDQQIEQLENQLHFQQQTNASLLDRMEDLSVVSKAGAESIRESLQSLGRQYSFIEDLTQKIQAKDSLNLVLVMNLKRSLADVNDEDVQVEVRGGVVYVSIADKLLFESGSARINARAMEVLDKLALVLNDHRDLNVLVEGHTDDVPINNRCVQDNWDLSVRRATAVVRALHEDFYVKPERLTAAGRSKYDPKAGNDTETGRRSNRRTEIIITPRLDQFFELLEAPELEG